jgi:hypothetical protein
MSGCSPNMDCTPGQGTPIDLDKMRSLRVISDARKTYTPGWTVTEPDGHVVDKCDSPVAAELHMDTGLAESMGI